MPNSRYVLSVNDDGGYHFNLVSPNNEIILSSEVYTAKASAINGIHSAQKNCTNDANYQRLFSKGQQPYFNLKSKDNGQVIGTSEMYSSEQAREKGVDSVKENGTTTQIVEI